MCCLAQLPVERKFPVQIPQQPDEIGETVGQTIDQSNQHMNEPWGKRKPSKDVDKEVCMLVQEWFARCYNQNLNNIIFDRQRICSHWIILCKKKSFQWDFTKKKTKQQYKNAWNTSNSKFNKKTSPLQKPVDLFQMIRVGYQT